MTYQSTADQESNIAAAEHRAAQRARMPRFWAVMDAHAHRSMQQTIRDNRAAGIERAYQRDIQFLTPRKQYCYNQQHADACVSRVEWDEMQRDDWGSRA